MQLTIERSTEASKKMGPAALESRWSLLSEVTIRRLIIKWPLSFEWLPLKFWVKIGPYGLNINEQVNAILGTSNLHNYVRPINATVKYRPYLKSIYISAMIFLKMSTNLKFLPKISKTY